MSQVSLNNVPYRRPAVSGGLGAQLLSMLTLVFAVLSLVFFILLVFLRVPFPPYPLINYQDVFDILTPLVLIPLYWILFRFAAREAPGLGGEITFLVLVAFWVEGQGMHLSANSISNLMEALATSGLRELNGHSAYPLAHFYDELLGHFLWHVGVLGLAGLLIWRGSRRSAEQLTAWWFTVPAGLIYGFFLFVITVEGLTAWIGFPFSLLVIIFGFRNRETLRQKPILAFFVIAGVVAFLLYSIWGLYWGGFPEFGEVGII